MIAQEICLLVGHAKQAMQTRLALIKAIPEQWTILQELRDGGSSQSSISIARLHG